MTTAHRPTWQAAVGGSEQGGAKVVAPSKQHSSKDLPGFTKMKARDPRSIKTMTSTDFKRELLEREQQLQQSKGSQQNLSLEEQAKIHFLEPGPRKKLKIQEEGPEIGQKSGFLSKDQDSSSSTSSSSDESEELEKLNKELQNNKKGQHHDEEQLNYDESDEETKFANFSYQNPFPQDADDENFKNSSDEDKGDGSSDSDSEDEQLMKEFEKIKREREEAQKKKEREEAELTKREKILRNNELLDQSGYSLSKKWYEDTIFKNQARQEEKTKKRFINDTVRSDFHKKFLSKYIFT